MLLRNALIADSETTRLRRGAGLHEFSFFDVAKRQVKEFIVAPNAVQLQARVPQDVTGLASSSKDIHTRLAVNSWQETIAHEVLEATGVHGNPQAQLEALRWSNPFLYKNLISRQYPHLTGAVEDNTARTQRFASFGISADLGNKTTIEELVRTHIPAALNPGKDAQGLTFWGANVGFESKQIGSQIAAQQALGDVIDWKSMLETSNMQSPDPFHVTGREVNQARVSAQITGDWRGVYKAYKQYVPKAGEVAVRDIQDVTRGMMSFAREAGLQKGGGAYFGTSIDISHKIAAIVKGDVLHRGLAETHRAAEDSAIHEDYVLKAHSEWAEALQHSEEKTPLGLFYRAQAQAGHGPLAEVAKASSLLEQIAPQLNRKNLLQRLGRAHEDLATTGETYQTTGVEGFYNMSQQTPSSGSVKIAKAQHSMHRFTTMEELGEHLAANDHYGDFGLDVRAETQRFMAAAPTRQAGAEYVEREINSTMSTIEWDKLTPSVRALSTMERGASRAGQAAIDVLEHVKSKPSSLLLGAAALTATGAAWSLVQSPPEKQSSLLGFGYQEWLDAQEGMASQGLAKETRSQNTDFGSPYRGPIISSEVFNDQKMLAEREKWLRAQYGASFHDPQTGLFGLFSVFNQRGGHKYVQEGQKVANGYQGLRGNNLVSLNLDDGWKINVEDADTISVKRGGVRGAISSFFGLNSGYSFRLAGIDSEETSHNGRAAQPYGDQAKVALQAMMDGSKNHEIVFDPTNITYGRMMAGLVADGRNLNIEMVKQGVAAALPFGSQKDAMVDYQDIIKANDRAVEAQRGMWAQPWGQAMAAITNPRNRPTFNALADINKVVANSSQMSLLAIANASQKEGSFDAHRLSASTVQMNMGADDMKPHYYDAPVGPSNTYMNELMVDTKRHMTQHGNYGAAGVSARGGYGKFDQYLAVDSMGTTNSVWTKRRYAAFDQYETDKVRNKQRALQQAALQARQSAMMFQSPINHSRM